MTYNVADILTAKEDEIFSPYDKLVWELLTPSLMATSIHEAGHAVACIHLGVDFDYVTIEPEGDDNGAHLISYGHIHYPARTSEEKYLITGMAGPAATKKQFSHQGYLQDDYFHVVDNIAERYPDACEGMLYFDHLEALADELVEKFWHDIEVAANALIEHVTLSEGDLRNVLQNVRMPLWHWELTPKYTSIDWLDYVERRNAGLL
jgi:hypothetical protein